MTANISSIHDRQFMHGAMPLEHESQELFQRQANQLEMLLDLSRGITAHVDADALYRTILSGLRRLIACQNAVIYKYEAGTQKLFPVAELVEKATDAAHNEENGRFTITTKNLQREKVHMHSSTSVAAWAAAHRHPILHAPSKLTADDDGGGLAPLKVAEMAIPLVSKHILYGVIVLQRVEAFTSEELRIVRNLSNMAAAALENVELFYRVRTDQDTKANFLSMITHELRSPLNAINGYLDLTLTGIAGALNEQQQEFVQRARAGSEHLYALVEDLLLVSRADAGQVRLNKDVTDLQDIITNAIEELELMAKDNGSTLHVQVAEDFPPIYADAIRIQQVLRNLLSNALRFTPAGGQVTIAASIIERTGAHSSATSPDADESRWLKIEVIDTGNGIAPEYQTRIFERFYQAPHASSGRASGQGLGLAIVKMIVELHGGEVSVASAPGKGSTFTCLLPCLLS